MGKAAVSDADPALTSIARAVAYLALHAAELTNSDLMTKATFLERQLGYWKEALAGLSRLRGEKTIRNPSPGRPGREPP